MPVGAQRLATKVQLVHIARPEVNWPLFIEAAPPLEVAELLDWNRQLAKRTSGPLALAPIEVRLTAPPACTARLPTKRELWISMASVWARSAPPLLPALLSAKVHQRMRTM